MAVETTWSGAGRPLPPAVDLAAYRVVQEALTNARHHAPGAAVSVAVAVDDTGVRADRAGRLAGRCPAAALPPQDEPP
jgi:signal transduction histidine kinase